MANILSTSTSALNAAQQGLATTAHNIANVKTPGYNRQVLLQAAVGGQDEGGGFIGKGTEVVSVRRVYNEYLGAQIRTAQTKQGELTSHYTQANRINSLLADPTSGLSPVLQDFFKSVQNLAANPEARGSMLAAAESMSSRFQSLDGQLQELRGSVNSEISTSISAINSYAQQIADLNKAIASAEGGGGQLPNDLMDKRDYLVAELSKETKVTVTKDGANYGIFIGNGQPMVVGSTVAQLAAVPSPTDDNELSVGLVTGSGVVRLADSSLAGGKLGGLFEFRTTTLTNAQNALGRIALGLASTFNEQHKLGMDQNASMGTDFFGMASPVSKSASTNVGTGSVGATIADVGELMASDYKITFDGTDYKISRMTDNKQVYAGALPPATAVDGLNFALTSGAPAAGDYFIVKPTVNGASGFKVLVTDTTNIAAAAPITTATPLANAGTGSVSAGQVDKNFLPAMVTPQVTLAYDAANKELNDPATGPGTGFAFPVKLTKLDGTSTIYSAGTPVPYISGATITFGASLPGPPADVGGVSIKISGAPADGDKFTVGKNSNASGDNRNTVLLGALQTADTLAGKTTTYQGALAYMVSAVGNKTHELEVGKDAQTNLVNQLRQTQDSDSGVNLDEEAANMLRYQQAYVAAGKVMQTVKEMFDMLVSMGR